MTRDTLIRLLITVVLLASLIPAARLTAHAAPLPAATLWRWLGGGDISDVFFLGDGRHGWAATTQGFLLRTEDGGAAWQYVPGVPVSKVYFVSAGRGYGIGSGGIWLTTDGGLTWTAQQTDIGNLADIQFISPAEGWAAGGAEVYHTADGGTSWTPQVPITGSIVAISFVDAQYGWAINTKSIQYTTNGGVSWSIALIFDHDQYLWDMQFVDRQHGWIVGEQVDRDDVGGVGSVSGLLLQTDDGGQTWHAIIPSSNQNTQAPSQADRVFQRYTNLYFRGDNGWIKGDIDVMDTRHEFYSYTSDGGQTWTGEDLREHPKRFYLPSWTQGYHGISIAKFPSSDLAVSEGERGIVTGCGWVYGCYPGVVFVSHNGGVTFEDTGFYFGEAPLVAFSDAGDAWLFATSSRDGSFLRSTDEAHWKQVWNGDCGNMCYQWYGHRLEMVDSAHGWLTVSKYLLTPYIEVQSIFATTDSGHTWVEQYTSTAMPLDDMSFVDMQHGWLLGGDTLLHTADGGQTWITQTANAPINAIQFVSPTLGWGVGISGTIQHTYDGGQTWHFQDSGTTATLHDLDFVDAANGWVVGDGGTILRTRDGGATWAIEASGTTARLTRVDMADAYNGWVIGDGGLILGRHLIPPPPATATQTATVTETPVPTATPTATLPTRRHYLPLALK